MEYSGKSIGKEILAFSGNKGYNKLIHFTYLYKRFCCVSEKFGSAGIQVLSG